MRSGRHLFADLSVSHLRICPGGREQLIGSVGFYVPGQRLSGQVDGWFHQKGGLVRPNEIGELLGQKGR